MPTVSATITLIAVRSRARRIADANHRRPPAIFAEVFAQLAAEADRTLRRDGMDMVKLIDSTPIQLGELLDWCTSNGRIRGLKMHVVYEHGRTLPRRIDITDANINDVEMGRAISIEKGTTYVFDKAYCHYGWWTQIHNNGAVFLTRKKENARFKVKAKRALTATKGDGFTILDDHDVTHTSKSNAGAKLDIPVRLIRLRRDDSRAVLTLITNDATRSAVEIGALYKARWQIELLFRWLKQNLELSCFLGRSDNAVRLQIYAAMIAFILLRLATQQHGSKHQPIRFAELIGQKLMTRRPIARVDKPPPVNAHIRQPRTNPGQLNLALQ